MPNGIFIEWYSGPISEVLSVSTWYSWYWTMAYDIMTLRDRPTIRTDLQIRTVWIRLIHGNTPKSEHSRPRKTNAASSSWNSDSILLIRLERLQIIGWSLTKWVPSCLSLSLNFLPVSEKQEITSRLYFLTKVNAASPLSWETYIHQSLMIVLSHLRNLVIIPWGIHEDVKFKVNIPRK